MRSIFCALTLLSLVGCATPQNNYDPLERVNRPVFAINEMVDTVVVRPAAVAWKDGAPEPLQRHVHSFFGNIDDLLTIPATFMRGKMDEGGRGVMRVLVNSSFGLGGLIDFASEMGLPKSTDDYGLVLADWGVGSGPYVVLPILGPTTLRDSVDPAIRTVASPQQLIDSTAVRMGVVALYGVDKRVGLLGVDASIEDAPDHYSFVRDAYLQQRWSKVYGGNPPKPLELGVGEGPDLSPKPSK